MTAPVEAAERFADQALPYSSQLYQTALRLTGNRADAEDLVQETCLRAYAGFKTFQPGTNLRAWLHRIDRKRLRSRLEGHAGKSRRGRAGPHRRRTAGTGPPDTRARVWPP